MSFRLDRKKFEYVKAGVEERLSIILAAPRLKKDVFRYCLSNRVDLLMDFYNYVISEMEKPQPEKRLEFEDDFYLEDLDRSFSHFIQFFKRLVRKR